MKSEERILRGKLRITIEGKSLDLPTRRVEALLAESKKQKRK